MEQTNQKPQAKAEKAKVKAAPVVIVLGEALKTVIANMVEAVVTEDLAIEQSKITVETVANQAWATCRDAVRAELTSDTTEAKAETNAMLDAFRDKCKEEGLARGVQYAANLRRAVKLQVLNDSLPAYVWDLGRTAWTNDTCWAPILAKTGAAKKPDAAKEKANAEVRASVETRANAGEAALEVADELREIREALLNVHGQFRAEAIQAAIEAIQRVANKERQATGGTRA